jgi:mycothiol system anti-sigma-R factor
MSDCGPNCEETLEEIQRFLDGEVEQHVRIEIEQHLTGCNPCMQRTEFRRHLKIMISSKCSSEVVPADLQAKIMDLIHDLDTRPG